MLASGLAGCIFTAFSPTCLLLLHWLSSEPTLVVVVLSCSFMSLCAQFCSSLIYIMASEKEDLKALYVILGVFIHEAFRLLTINLIFKSEKVFRAHGQVLFSSRLRGVNIGSAVGVGFGLTQMVLHFGALAEAHPTLSQEGSTYFDIDICPQMPYLFYIAMMSCFLTICNVFWSIIMLQGWFAIARSFVVGRQAPSAAPLSPGGGGAGGSGDYGSSASNPNSATSMAELRGKSFNEAVEVDGDKDGVREAATPTAGGSRNNSARASATGTPRPGGDATTSGAGAAPSSPPMQAPRRIAPTTSFSFKEGVVTIIIAFLLHAVFSFTTLVNSGATDLATMDAVGSRGCIVSLPVAAVVTILSGVVAFFVVKLDALKRVSLGEV